MDTNEMSEYLVSIGGLRHAWGSHEIIINNPKFFGVGSGWYPIIKDLIDGLIKLGWDKNVIQVKQKFGGLRFYIDEGSDEMHKLIIEAERKSYETCEKCSEKGKARRDIGWHLTLCDEHYQEKIKEINVQKSKTQDN